MEKFNKDKSKYNEDKSKYKDSKLSIFPLIESIKIYISKSYRNFKADDNRSFTQSYFSDAVKLLLDTYPNAAAAYSLRKLSTSYQGPAIRVRRSSDNQEQDIYFDSLSNLDTNSLTSFVGSENLLLYSEQFDNPYWVKTNSSVTADANISPDGITSSDLIYPLSSGADRRIQKGIPVVSGTTYTVSVFAKASGLNWIRILEPQSFLNGAWFNLSNGTIGTIQSGLEANIQDFGNGWYRCSVTKTVTSTVTGQVYIQIVDNNNSQTVTVNGTSGVLLWGAQLNSGSLQTYSPTTTTARDGNGFVTTWYDQSGNSRNATQSTAASQPQIVSSGNVINLNSKPALSFDGTNDYLEALAVGSYNSHTFAMVFKRSLGYILSVQYNSPNSIIFWDLQIKYWTAVTTNQINTSETVNYHNLTFAFKDTSLQSIYINNILKGSIANPVSIGDSSLNMQIGYAIPRNNTLEYLNGTFQEIIYYPINRSSNREELSTNINSYYSIY